MPRIAAAFAALPLAVLGAASLAAVAWPRAAPTPPPTITLTVAAERPRTVTLAEDVPRTALRASTELDVPAPDLDGDGEPDLLVARPDSCGTGGCVYDVSRASAPRARLGTIEGKWGYWTVAPRRGSLADLTTTWFLGCCEVVETTYRFERGAYREVRSVTRDPRSSREGS